MYKRREKHVRLKCLTQDLFLFESLILIRNETLEIILEFISSPR